MADQKIKTFHIVRDMVQSHLQYSSEHQCCQCLHNLLQGYFGSTEATEITQVLHSGYYVWVTCFVGNAGGNAAEAY